MSHFSDDPKSSPPPAKQARDGADEFPLGLGTPLPRRSFLKVTGFTVAGLAACRRAPIEQAIPYLVQPETITPGRSYFEASTCGGCGAGCGVLVKCRDGRPIKLEGLPEHPVSQGGLCAVGQASLLSLYDGKRLRQPEVAGRRVLWEEADRFVAQGLATASSSGGRVRFLSSTLTSPTLAHWLERFLARFADGRAVAYDPLPASAILDAHAITHGERLLPRFRFDRADAVVAFGADFLGTWISPVEFTKGWRARRQLDDEVPRFSWHAQLEPRMSVTGGKADRRARLLPSEYGAALSRLAGELARRSGTSRPAGDLAPLPAAVEALLAEAAERLWAARGRALAIADSQQLATQLLVNEINHLLGSYGATLDVERPSRQRQGDERGLAALLAELEAGAVDALFVHDVNPLYELPDPGRWAAALAKAPLVVSLTRELDETARVAGAICPVPHPLESWGDAEAVAGTISVSQPAVAGLSEGRAVAESLATWLGEPRSIYELQREVWRQQIHPRCLGSSGFEEFWSASVHDGFAALRVDAAAASRRFVAPARVGSPAAAASSGLELVAYPKVAMLDGRHACNPWLQELPDPVSKITWDNYACLAPETAARLGVGEGDLVRISTTGGAGLELPAHLSPGQHERAVAVALGYGRFGTDRFAGVGPRWWFARPGVATGETVGRNVAALLAVEDGRLVHHRSDVRVERAAGHRDLACTQRYGSLSTPPGMAPAGHERRPIVETTTLAAFLADRRSGASPEPPQFSLWPPQPPTAGHRWGMVIDLAACTGCSACVISCQAENNVPVVGRDEIVRQREMHWIRIDRYFEGEGDDLSLAHQPMLCQHCGNAPCETVCPVLATVHSSEGLNQQVYNRCVGTRYCANNCPYKVRRFNWFDYPRADKLANMALNPDVVVRSRGVMEKCSLCVQRIQEAKSEAKRQGRAVGEGDIATACQQSCPADAIVFGDLADPQSRVGRSAAGPRHFHVLAELNVKPVVGYLRLVRDTTGDGAATPTTGEEPRHG